MNRVTKLSLLILRLAMGCVFLYAGVTKIIDPSWSAAGYLNSARTFPSLFQWFASPEMIGITNILNEWGLTLIGLSLLLGVLIKWSSMGGIVLMTLYYFPILNFPYAGTHSYIIDDHIIYILVFVLFIFMRAGEYWGVDKYIKQY